VLPSAEEKRRFSFRPKNSKYLEIGKQLDELVNICFVFRPLTLIKKFSPLQSYVSWQNQCRGSYDISFAAYEAVRWLALKAKDGGGFPY
jgi:hypothetical protein